MERDRIFAPYWAKEIAQRYEESTGQKVTELEITILEYHLKIWTTFVEKGVKQDAGS